MIVMSFEFNEEALGAISIRARREILKASWEAVATWWHKERLPRHFKRASYRDYKVFKRRSEKYRQRKRELAKRGRSFKRGGDPIQEGGEVPNLLTGRMRDALQRVGVIRVFPTRFTVRMTGPRYATMRPYRANQPPKGREIVQMTEREVRMAHKIWADTFAKLFDQAVKRGRRKKV